MSKLTQDYHEFRTQVLVLNAQTNYPHLLLTRSHWNWIGASGEE